MPLPPPPPKYAYPISSLESLQIRMEIDHQSRTPNTISMIQNPTANLTDEQLVQVHTAFFRTIQFLKTVIEIREKKLRGQAKQAQNNKNPSKLLSPPPPSSSKTNVSTTMGQVNFFTPSKAGFDELVQHLWQPDIRDFYQVLELEMEKVWQPAVDQVKKRYDEKGWALPFVRMTI